MKKILMTGATRQIGSELVPALRHKYGGDNVIAAGHKKPPHKALLEEGPYTTFDITEIESLAKVVREFRIDTIFHLAAILPAAAEQNPQIAWKVNMEGLYNVLEVSRENGCSVFSPVQ